MVGAGLVLDGILDELESRDADGIKGLMVGAAGVTHGERVHAQVFERLHPGFKDWGYRFVLLQIDASNLAGAVVHVEIGGDFRLFGFHSYLSSFSPQQGW